MYGKRVYQVSTNRTGIVSEPFNSNYPTIGVIPDDNPWESEAWNKNDVDDTVSIPQRRRSRTPF